MNALGRHISVAGLVLLLSLTGCDRLQTWLHPAQCALSGRPIDAGMGVRIQIDKRSPVRACCLRCAITASEHKGESIHVLSVTDYVSHAQIAPKGAFYVVGSGVTPCAGPPVEVAASRREAWVVNWDRCLPSVIAFAKRTDAEQFQQQSGGELQTFAEVTEGTTVAAVR